MQKFRNAPAMILIISACGDRLLIPAGDGNDEEKVAQQYCTPDNCLVAVLRNNTLIMRFEREPGSADRWHIARVNRPRRARQYRHLHSASGGIV